MHKKIGEALPLSASLVAEGLVAQSPGRTIAFTHGPHAVWCNCKNALGQSCETVFEQTDNLSALRDKEQPNESSRYCARKTLRASRTLVQLLRAHIAWNLRIFLFVSNGERIYYHWLHGLWNFADGRHKKSINFKLKFYLYLPKEIKEKYHVKERERLLLTHCLRGWLLWVFFFSAISCFNLGNKKSVAGHLKCSAGRRFLTSVLCYLLACRAKQDAPLNINLGDLWRDFTRACL